MFASFRSFALDAIGGPDAKTPGILFAVLSMALLVRRRWFWGALAGSLAFLAWQPLAVYAVLAVGAAAVGARRRGVRDAVAGAALPLAAAVVWLWLAGVLPAAEEATVDYPLHGVERVPETLGGRIAHIAREVGSGYGTAGLLIAAGLVALVAVAVLRLRRTWAIVVSLVTLVVFSLHDFQGTADAYPLLPYAAIGVAGACALLAGRWRAAVGTLAVVALFAATWIGYSKPLPRTTHLVRQEARAAAVERLLDPGERFEALGDPISLVLTGSRDPTRFVYMSEGVGDWALRHEFGGFEGFVAGIRAREPAVVVVDAWTGPLALRTKRGCARATGRSACATGWSSSPPAFARGRRAATCASGARGISVPARACGT